MCKRSGSQKPKDPAHDKTYKMACASSEDSDQPGHPPSLISVLAVRSMCSQGPKHSSRTAKTLVRLGGCHFVGFVLSF